MFKLPSLAAKYNQHAVENTNTSGNREKQEEFLIDRGARTISLAKRLENLSNKNIDVDIYRRLKQSHGTVDYFLDQAEIENMLKSNMAIDDKYILTKVDKHGMMGKKFRKQIGSKEKDNGSKEVHIVQKDVDFDPVEVLKHEEDVYTRKIACKKLIYNLIHETGCDFILNPSWIVHDDIPKTIYTDMLQRFRNRPMLTKFEMFEYLSVLIEIIMKEQKMNHKQYNYNNIAEKYADTYHVSNKEKEVLIELLEAWFPPSKRDLNELKAVKKVKSAIVKKQVVKKIDQMDKDKKLHGLDSSRPSGLNTARDHYMSQEEGLKYVKKRTPELKEVQARLEEDPARFAYGYNMLLGLKEKILPNYSQSKIESLIGDRALDFVDVCKFKDSDQHIIFIFGENSIVVKNVMIDESVLYLSISSFPHFETLQTIEINNTNIRPLMVKFLLDLAICCCPKLVSVHLRHQPVDLDIAKQLGYLVSKRNLKNITLHGCRLKSPELGEICLGVIQNQGFEQLDVSNNEIDNFGINFLCSVIRYNEQLRFVDISNNCGVTNETVALLEKAYGYMKRVHHLVLKYT